MKARRVDGLNPELGIGEAAARIVRMRWDEVRGFVPRALDARKRRAAHDMRIAVKRLRYVLEVTSPVFGPHAAEAALQMRSLQDVLGKVHDCDVLIPLVRDRIGRAPDSDAEALWALVAHLQARRADLHARFVRRWAELEAENFTAQLHAALEQRPGTDRPAGERRPDTMTAADPAGEMRRDLADSTARRTS